MRVKTPSVTTSMRVLGPDLVTMRARNPMRSPTASDRVCAMRSAAARAAMRRGSSTRILRPWSQPSAVKASGARVVLPAPGGATRAAQARAAKASRNWSRTASIGRGVANFMSAVSGGHGRCASAISADHQGVEASSAAPSMTESGLAVAVIAARRKPACRKRAAVCGGAQGRSRQCPRVRQARLRFGARQSRAGRSRVRQSEPSEAGLQHGRPRGGHGAALSGRSRGLRSRLQRRAQLVLLLRGERCSEHARLVGLDFRKDLVGCRALDENEQGRGALRDGLA